MLLENKFYRILDSEQTNALNVRYHVELLTKCDVYNGHFPGNPVCPGVCNIETIKECAMLLMCKSLRYSSIKQCRLTAIASPTICPQVYINVSLTENSEGYQIQSSIEDDHQVYMVLKGQLVNS